MTTEEKIKRLKSGGFIRWQSPFCSEKEREQIRKIGPVVLHYGGVTTARFKRR